MPQQSLLEQPAITGVERLGSKKAGPNAARLGIVSIVRVQLDLWPLILVTNPRRFDEAVIRAMNDEYERIWERGERYAIVSHVERTTEPTTAGGRRLLAEWAGRPRVRRMSRELCVGTATVVPNPIARGGLTALLWLWTPPSPHQAVATTEEAVDWCLARIDEAGLALPKPAAEVRRAALSMIRD